MQFITLEDLLNKESENYQFLIPDLLGPGLYILAGKPKSGKSLLAIQLSYNIAHGYEMLGRETLKSPVMYLALEDSEEHMKKRLLQMDFCEGSDDMIVSYTAKSIGNGFEEELRSCLKDKPDTKLVIIDTLQMIRNGNNAGTNVYASDYADMGKLKAIADEYKITLLVITHTRKMKSNDPFAMITGSNGITGVADGMMVLERETGSPGCGTLHCRGRDIEEQDIALTFNSDNIIWQLRTGDKKVIKFDDATITNLIEYLNSTEGNCFRGSPTELSDKLNESKQLNTTPNDLPKRIIKFMSQLAAAGYTYCPSRTHEGRLIDIHKCSEK